MNPADIADYRDSIDAETVKEKALQHRYLGGVTLVFLLAFALRYMPERGMQYLQAADPYYIFRMSQHIALEGHLPQLDFMRYFPYAAPNYTVQLGELLIPAVLYNAGFSLFFENYLEWAQFFPAMMGALTVIPMYFLGKELFNRKTGLAAAFFLTVTSGALRRASAGFFEKEPIGTFLMVFSLLFFTRAWKNQSWRDGIISGITLGLFTISWGGSQMLWLLYPILAGATLFINEETRSLVTSYTPTVLVAGLMAAASNPGRFWFNDSLFLISLGVLGLLWSRYLVEEFEIVQERYLPYFVPSVSVLGGLMALLSPLYSQWLAGRILRFVQIAIGDTGSGVVGQTVQENAPPGVSSLATELGSVLLGNVSVGIEMVAALTGAWTFMLFGLTFMSTSLLLMLARKYSLIEEVVSGRKSFAYTQAVFVALMVFMVGLVQNFVFISAFAAGVIGASILVTVYFLDDESAFSIASMFLAGTVAGLVIASLRFSGGIASNFAYLTLWPSVAALGASVVKYYADDFREREIELRWYSIIPVIWIASNVYGGTTRARLVFLSTFAVALGAGYGFTVFISELRKIDFDFTEAVESEKLRSAAVITVLALVVGMNFFSAFTSAQSIRGSPTPSPELWEPSIDYMQNETPEGSVTLSWWDYGYNFQTLGRTGSAADGGNLRYYSSEGNHMNTRLAQYLNSTVEGDTEYINQSSSDYIWLDNSMIGKFAAVSQIARGDNQDFQVISRVRTTGTLQNSLSQDGNQTAATFRGRIGRNPVEVFAPVEFTNTSAELSGSPTVRFGNGQTAGIDCVLTEDGRETFQVERSLDYCAVEDPFYSLERGIAGTQSRMALVPKRISNSTFVRLYLQDGYGVDYAEKIPEASNGYIKMWEITE